MVNDLWSRLVAAWGSPVGPHTQTTRLLRLYTPLGPDVLLAERMQAVEIVGPGPQEGVQAFVQRLDDAGAGFVMHVHALSADPNIDLSTLVGQPVLLELLTASAVDTWRPWHGHIVAATREGSDGGLTRYRLNVQPWAAFLAHGRDSWVFQDRSVMDIVDEVLSSLDGQGTLAPSWRWDLHDPSMYPRRSLCIQYQETDLAFVQRLLREEGITCWWEHEGDPTSPGLGRHTLVLADHSGACRDNPQPAVRYTQSHVSMREDSLTRWQRQARVLAGAVALASRDYRSRSRREVEHCATPADLSEAAAAAGLTLSDVPGTYAYEDRAQGERLVRAQLEGLDAARERVRAEGPWRHAEVATRFVLRDHPVHDGLNPQRDAWRAVAVVHEARNNLSADLRAALPTLAARIAEDLAPTAQWAQGDDALEPEPHEGAEQDPSDAGDPSEHDSRNRLGNERGDAPIHRCVLWAEPAARPLRPPLAHAAALGGVGGPAAEGSVTAVDADDPFADPRGSTQPTLSTWQGDQVLPGAWPPSHATHATDAPGARGLTGPLPGDVRLNTRPRITGVQTAIVVGLQAPVHTDRDHRIKIQFHWQRGPRASHRLAHRFGENAPASDASGTWVRVAATVAGANWGSHFVPRVGQEVLVAFIGGDIDRPVVIGALYNGQGREDAQGNRIAAGAADASGQSPAWFPGQKAAEVAGRTWPGHQHPAALAGVKSQELNHTRTGGGGYNQIVFDDSPGAGRLEVYSSTAQTRLQLGHLRHQVDNRLLQTRGHGLDLATQAWGAVRAASGLLLSAHARPSSTASTATHDAREAVGLLVSAAERQRVLSHSAQRQQVRLPDEPDVKLPAQDTPPRPDPDGKSEPALQATLAVEALTRSLSGQDEASPAGADDDEGMGGGEGRAAKWRDPDLVGSAPAGVVWHTPAHATVSADGSVSVTAGQGLDLVAQQGLSAHARGGLSLYTEGREPKGEAAGKPDKSRGLKLHARQGVLSAQSQNGRTDVAARKRVDLFSCEDTLTIAGKAGVLLAAGGAGIEIIQGAIHLKGPGSVLFKASQKIYNPGGGAGHGFQSLPGPIELGPVCHEQFQAVNPVNGRPVAGMPYRIVLADGQELAGRTDAEGKTMPVTTLNSKGVQLFWEPESFPDEPEQQDYIPDC